MRDQLGPGLGAAIGGVQGPDGSDGQAFAPTAELYLNTAFFPRYPESSIGMRTARELKTLAKAVDAICRGEVPQCLDVLLQRMKALEVLAAQGSWNQARWLELIPPQDVASWGPEELREAQRLETMERRLMGGGGPPDAGRGRGRDRPQPDRTGRDRARRDQGRGQPPQPEPAVREESPPADAGDDVADDGSSRRRRGGKRGKGRGKGKHD